MAMAGGTLAVQCEGKDLEEVVSLQEVPPDILAILHNQKNSFAIADRGGEYQMTDVMVDKELPFRRCWY
jgi:hypothetical protein